jgi:hypothetical protein
MNVGSVSGYSSFTPSITQPQALQASGPAQVGATTDPDRDGDIEARESGREKAAEARPAPSLPVDPSRGRTLNISV